MFSIPFEDSNSFGLGEFERTHNILNIQPVIPTKISKKWNLINRLIIPLVSQPAIVYHSVNWKAPEGDQWGRPVWERCGKYFSHGKPKIQRRSICLLQYRKSGKY